MRPTQAGDSQRMAERCHTWLERYSWFTDLVNELLDDMPGKWLDA